MGREESLRRGSRLRGFSPKCPRWRRWPERHEGATPLMSSFLAALDKVVQYRTALVPVTNDLETQIPR